MATTQLGNSLLKPESGWNRKYFQADNVNTFFQGLRDKDKYQNATWFIVGENDNPSAESCWVAGDVPQNTNNDIFSFTFTGTAFRIMQKSSLAHRYNIKVRIDGGNWIKGSVIYNNPSMFRVCFEKLDLPSDTHRVEVTYDGFTTGSNDKNHYTFLSAFDYADLSTKVGDVLKEPEPGWKRYDDGDSLITYEGVWEIRESSSAAYGKYHVCGGKSKIHFSFVGSKLRIIGVTSRFWSGTVNVEIDGNKCGSYRIDDPDSYGEFSVLLYEKDDLQYATHNVVLHADGTSSLDALDFGEPGGLVAPIRVGDVLKEPESGWKRFDDRDPNILYQGNWIKNENITTHYRGTFHNKPSSSGDDSIIKALFDFSGTKIRIIAFMTTGSYDVGTIKIDDEAFNFSYIKGTPTAQCLVFEKTGLDSGVHKVELSGRYINLDAIDIDDTGELIPIETKKPKVSLYEKESGKIFVDDFDSINPKWLMSPSSAFNNAAKKGFLRMNHSADKDVMLLINKPQGNIAIQVIADYTPTKEGDKGGLLLYKNEDNNIEFLESMKVSDSPDPKEWMAVCKENQWDFYNKTDVTFDYVRSEQLEAHKIGVVLKKGNAEGFTPLDINKIIITTSNLLRLRQLYEKYKVVLKDTAENVISTSFVEAANTGIDIPLPSLEFEGIIEIYDEDGTLVAKRQTTFFGGDMYCMGSSLHISMDTKELDETDPTHLGYMTETEQLVKMTLTNDNVGPVSNVKVAIQQYMEKFGYTWAHLSLDGSHYTNELAIEILDAGSSKDFWVKIIKDVNYMAFEPIYFNIHLSHE